MPCDCSGMEPLQNEYTFLSKINYVYTEIASETFIIADVTEHLCKICKKLNKEQMMKIYLTYPEANLLKWYLNHLISDYRYNFDEVNKEEREVVLSELKRLGYEIVKTRSKPEAPNDFYEVKKIKD